MEAKEAYDSAYCGLCYTMGKEYGFVSRLFLNYDFVFLAMLLAPKKSFCLRECRKCPLHPVKGKSSCVGGDWMETAAGESVILAWWKLRDTIVDGGSFSRLGARLLSLFLGSAYRRARERCPEFDKKASQLLRELQILEWERCPSIDQTADCFARLLQAAVPRTGEAGVDRPREQLLYHLGRWIYLVDAVDDLPGDRKAKRYNPVAARFSEWSEKEKSYLRQNMDHSLALMGAAFQLLPANDWSDGLENIIYSGLPAVEELVFSGKWREYQKKHRRNDG